MENVAKVNEQEKSWSEINRAECENSSLCDMCSWKESD